MTLSVTEMQSPPPYELAVHPTSETPYSDVPSSRVAEENNGDRKSIETNEALQASFKTLHGEVATFQAAEERQLHRGDEKTIIEAGAERVAAAMEAVGNSHPDPKARLDWHRKAKQFSRASKKTRGEILKHVGHVVGIVLSIPCCVVGTSLHIAGGAIHMAGSVVGGIGDAVLGSSEGRRASRPPRL